jgi:hypothetical protein
MLVVERIADGPQIGAGHALPSTGRCLSSKSLPNVSSSA